MDYTQPKKDEEIAVLGQYSPNYQWSFSLITTADIQIHSITIPCKSNYYDSEGHIKETYVTLFFNGDRYNQFNIGEDYKNVTYDLNYHLSANSSINIILESLNSIKLWVGYGITAYSSGDSGILNVSETLPNFTINYTINTESWLQNSEVNDGYPYYTWAIKQDMSGEINRPKPWWVWKIDATKTINAGYPYIIAEEVAPPVTQFQWYVCLNSELLPAIPYINGVPAITYVGGL